MSGRTTYTQTNIIEILKALYEKLLATPEPMSTSSTELMIPSCLDSSTVEEYLSSVTVN
jgi:hypothetical protein